MFGDKTHANGLAMTATGQTGTDAYANELAQIANAQRDLDERMANLVRIISEELPADVVTRHSIATDSFPDAFIEADRDSLRKQLAMTGASDTFTHETVGEIIKALADPSYAAR